MSTPDSTQMAVSEPIHRGLWLFPLAGIIIAVLTLLWIVPPPGTPANPAPADMARMMASAFALVVFGWLYFVALIALTLGLQALYGALAAGPGQRWALGGLVLSVASVAVLLTAFGAAALGGAVVADSYLRGNTGTVDAMEHLSGGSFGPAILQAFMAAWILAAAGAIANGVAIWRSATLPRWSAIGFGIGFVLVAASFPFATTLGGILLVVSGVAIARSPGRRAVTGEGAATTMQPA